MVQVTHPQSQATYLLLQLESLPIKGPPGLLASLSKESVLQLVGGSVPQRRHQALEPHHLRVSDLDGAGQFHIVLPRQSLADGCNLAQLFLVELGPQVGDGDDMLVLLELAGLPLLLEPLTELAQLVREQQVLSPDMCVNALDLCPPSCPPHLSSLLLKLHLSIHQFAPQLLVGGLRRFCHQFGFLRLPTLLEGWGRSGCG